MWPYRMEKYWLDQLHSQHYFFLKAAQGKKSDSWINHLQWYSVWSVLGNSCSFSKSKADSRQSVRFSDCWQEMLRNNRASQGTALFMLYIIDFQYNTNSCNLQKSSDEFPTGRCTDTAVDLEYKNVVHKFSLQIQ